MSEPPPASPATDLQTWIVQASRHIVSDRWLRLRADDCITADGARIAPYYVLDYPDWVQVVALDPDENIILIEQYRHGLGVISLELPAGGIEPTGEGPLEAAARELMEETGYAAKSLSLIAALSPNPANHSNRTHVVLARDVTLRQAPEQNPLERLRVMRLPIEDVIRRVMQGDVVQAMHVASLALALTAIGRWRC